MKFYRITVDGEELGYREAHYAACELAFNHVDKDKKHVGWNYFYNFLCDHDNKIYYDGHHCVITECEIPNCVPTIIATHEDLKDRYDCSGLTNAQLDEMLEEVAAGMNDDDSIMEYFWAHIDEVAEEAGLQKL